MPQSPLANIRASVPGWVDNFKIATSRLFVKCGIPGPQNQEKLPGAMSRLIGGQGQERLAGRYYIGMQFMMRSEFWQYRIAMWRK